MEFKSRALASFDLLNTVLYLYMRASPYHPDSPMFASADYLPRLIHNYR